ncbi:hypothetical protein [Litorimonas cladophorae]|nr:hypothetical protein [Litorimonas cladophorae]
MMLPYYKLSANASAYAILLHFNDRETGELRRAADSAVQEI